ncbi:hypothetical protein CSC94_08040 [Zhengella mangrovi]|uniref:Thioesterase domain-containing protein n=1 Tax=Zhengella mangrovi TaxID=1982044 RepID=A0A2G1QQ85_9HYPH|nr:PaaI family thioesterase [Zhengella mangrovi]PHP67639.1 hypothetical protein CSC94_08040 [Zhengella mangrovi]
MSLLTTTETDAVLEKMFAPFIRRMGLKTVSVGERETTFLLPGDMDFVHGGGVICGQAIASAADTCAILALAAANGRFRMVTTVDLTTHFIRPLKPVDAHVRIVIESNGKRMAYLRAEIAPVGSDKLSATATGAFMYLD